VVVVNAATPVLMPWLDDVAAVVWAGLPGQEAGRAVAAALLGDIEPAGRLVTTFPREDGASPAWEVVPDDGVLAYEEGVWIGYRGHAAGRAPAPAFWFGHGLGYATWEYADPRVDLTGKAPRVSLALTNSSTRDSREVVQVYLDPEDADQPTRLVGWTSVRVSAGSSVDVDVSCDERMWRTWDGHGWRVLTGGRLLVARGLGDVRLDVALPSDAHSETIDTNISRR
jgi:beta-glucosidase